MACGGHAWSRDGLTWSNQSIGAFGPALTFSNGSSFVGAYAERPQVLQAADGTPLAFYMGLGRASYMDSANWAMLFCTSALNATRDCGPLLPPPPPPPDVAHPKQKGACLISNASAFPCAGGWANSCPVTLGSCSDPTAAWAWTKVAGGGVTLTSLSGVAGYSAGTVINVDCEAVRGGASSCDTGTLVKLTRRTEYAAALVPGPGGTLGAAQCPGMCLSGAAGLKREAPCKAGEYSAPEQVVLVPCKDAAAAGGWTF